MNYCQLSQRVFSREIKDTISFVRRKETICLANYPEMIATTKVENLLLKLNYTRDFIGNRQMICFDLV